MVIKKIGRLFFCLILLGCEKSDLKNNITISLKVINYETKTISKNDTVEVRSGKWGMPVKRYIKVAEYITDSSGFVKINLKKDEEYKFTVYSGYGSKFSVGSEYFPEGSLKNNQQVVIAINPFEKNNKSK